MSLFGRSQDADPGVASSVTPGRSQQDSRGATPGRAKQRTGDTSVANIGESILFKGELSGKEDLVLEGTVEGRVDLPENQLTIGSNGRANAELNAKTVVVVGRVTGNIRASERIEIQATGVVEGDVSAPRLMVAEGAVVNGSIEMGASQRTAQSQTPAAASPPPPERKAG